MEILHFIFLRIVFCYFVSFPTTLNSEIPSFQMLDAAASQVINREIEILILTLYCNIFFINLSLLHLDFVVKINHIEIYAFNKE
jgi:hypothetical protein